MIINKRNGENYLDVIKQIPGQRITLEDQATKELVPDTLHYAIRHDVDHDIDKALSFAREEQEAGIRATYFLLPTAPYFDYSDKFYYQVLDLRAMGHHIGYHNNAITEWFDAGGKTDIFDIIVKPLGFLNETGMVIGTASHGDPMCHKLNYINYEVWEECPAAYRREHDVAYPRLSLKDVVLDYEAYFLQRDAYLSDSGGRWQGAIGGELIRPHEDNPEGDDVKQKVIKGFAARETGIMQVLVHPCWWEVMQ